MKKLMIAALLAGQMAAVQPAIAAELDSSQRMGAFGGLRVRLPLDGNVRDRQLRAGLAIAPTLRTQNMAGESRLLIGEGLELGLRGREPLRLSIAGQDLRRLGAQESGDEDDDDDGIPTGAWIAGGIVLVAIAGVTWLAIELDNASD